jgi:hypothetical protein
VRLAKTIFLNVHIFDLRRVEGAMGAVELQADTLKKSNIAAPTRLRRQNIPAYRLTELFALLL